MCNASKTQTEKTFCSPQSPLVYYDGALHLVQFEMKESKLARKVTRALGDQSGFLSGIEL